MRDITLRDLTIVGGGANYSWEIAWDNGPTGPSAEGYQSNYIMTAMQQGQVGRTLSLTSNFVIVHLYLGCNSPRIVLCCAQVYLENATGITIAGCALLAAGQSAVWMQGWAQNNTITGNLIKESGFCSVYVK